MSAKDGTAKSEASAATPMIAQYLEIKAANPDCLLFYRMGDFYEMFFEDAVQAAEALDITLTKRGRHQGADIPMCGVPVHSADDYLQTLIRKGFRVAVCEQVGDPAEAKKRGSKSVVQRDVTRLVTRGTLTEDSLLDARQSNYLMAVGRTRESGGDAYATAWTDISTGKLYSMALPPYDVASEIARLEPGEILIPDTIDWEHDIGIPPRRGALTQLPARQFDSAAGERRLTETFAVRTIEGFGSFSRAEIGALGALIGYVELTQRGRLPALTPPQRIESGRAMLIDQATRANLELTRTLSGDRQGSLLGHMDRTVTGAGARALASRLVAPSTAVDEIGRRLDAVAYFTEAEVLRAEVRHALRSIPEMVRPLSRLSLGRGGPRDLGALRAGLSGALALPTLIERHRSLTPPPDEIATAIGTLEAGPHDLVARLAATLADELPANLRDGGLVRSGFNSELDEARTLGDETRQVIAGLQSRYQAETSIKPLKVKHNNVLGYFVEVPAGHAATLTAGDGERFIHRQTLANQMRFTTSELADLEVRIAEASNHAQTIEERIFAELSQEVIAASSAIASVSDAIAGLDIAAGLGELAVSERYCRPVVNDSLSFNIVAGRHPVVEHAREQTSSGAFVANNCALTATDPARGSLWLLTGPNMAGKSTFLRQNALIAILAQMGSFVPADSAEVGIVDRLFSRVGASDDLAGGRSTFMVEMVETAAILNQAGPRSFVILDEIGRGTATFDGLAIAWATLEHLHEINRCRTLFATHFHELTALSETLSHVVNMTMRVSEYRGEVVFLHEVVAGAADRSYGVQVARLAGLPDSVIDRAGTVLEMLEKNGKSSSFADLADDLPLFSAARPNARPVGRESPVEARLAGLAPDELTPREALALIYELHALATPDGEHKIPKKPA